MKFTPDDFEGCSVNGTPHDQLTATRSVEGAQGLQQVLGQHDTWLREAKVLGAEATFAPVTWSTWDLKVRQLL